jgi:serine/threonine protein kinase/tetratricopeptide (TPR) repeat protein
MSSESHLLSDDERQLRRACVELDRRLRGGERGVAAKLFDGDPRLSTNAESALELIYTECVTLEELGERASLDAWLTKFPQWTDRLHRLWKLHEAFDEAGPGAPGAETVSGREPSRPTPPEEDSPHSSSGNKTAPSRWLGQYELLEEVDRGGMGVVYRARQRGLNRIVAVKSIRSATVSESDRARFRLEAEAAAKLEHPNIVRVYEVSEHDGYDFLSMEFIEGGSLQRRLKEGRLSPRLAAELIATLADTVQFAHDHGIVHRDLKPGNILICGEWADTKGQRPLAQSLPVTIKITDFGLAKRFRDNANAKTQAGAILGTPSYMSPEQADGRQADVGPQSDIYSLGAILYELLTGLPPFEAPTAIQTLQWIRSRDPVPPERLAPDVPRDLATICLKCLHKEPARRYASARDLADDVRCFLDHRPIRARPTPWTERSSRWVRRHSLIAALAAALFVVCAVSGGLFVWQQYRVGHLTTLAASTERVAVQQEKRAAAAEADAEASFQQSRELVEQWTRLGEQLYQQPGMDELRRQALEKALEFYSQFLAQHGDDPQLRLATARAAIRAGVLQSELGHWEPSEKNLTQAISLFDSLPVTDASAEERLGALLHLAHVRRRLERWSESEATYQEAIDSGKRLVAGHPDNDRYTIVLANALINICVVLNHDQRWDESEKTFGQAIRLLRQMIERRLSTSQSPSAGEAELTASKSAASPFSPADEIRASRELRERLAGSSSQILRQLAAGKYLTELALCLDDLGLLLYRRGKTAEASEAYMEAFELRHLAHLQSPSELWMGLYLARSHTHLGEVAERLQRPEDAAARYREAITWLDRLHKEAPARVDYTVDLGQAYASLAGVRLDQEQFADAISNYRLAVAIQEQLVANTPAVNSLKRNLAASIDGLGRALAANGEDREALEAYRRALQVDGTYAQTLNNLAWRLLIARDHTLRDPAKALQLSQQAVELNPKSRASWHTLGTAQFRAGSLDAAEKSLQKSMDIGKGGSAHDWFYMAAIQAKRGNAVEARSWFDRAKAWRESQMPRDGELRMIQEEATVALAEAEDGKGP